MIYYVKSLILTDPHCMLVCQQKGCDTLVRGVSRVRTRSVYQQVSLWQVTIKLYLPYILVP